MEWTRPLFLQACQTTLQSAMDQDYTKFKQRQYFPYKRGAVNQGEGEHDYESGGMNPAIPNGMADVIANAARVEEFATVEAIAREKMPQLFEAHSLV